VSCWSERQLLRVCSAGRYTQLERDCRSLANVRHFPRVPVRQEIDMGVVRKPQRQQRAASVRLSAVEGEQGVVKCFSRRIAGQKTNVPNPIHCRWPMTLSPARRCWLFGGRKVGRCERISNRRRSQGGEGR
jgi:hypothetical protein